jgi:hypothetical protein
VFPRIRKLTSLGVLLIDIDYLVADVITTFKELVHHHPTSLAY